MPNFLPEKRHIFFNLVPRGFYFSGIRTVVGKVSKGQTLWVLQNVLSTPIYESMS